MMDEAAKQELAELQAKVAAPQLKVDKDKATQRSQGATPAAGAASEASSHLRYSNLEDG